MYKQETPSGCGLYAVANALNLPKKFITAERLEESKTNGNNIGQLSKWLQETGYPIYIQPLHYNQERGISDKAMRIKPEVEGDILPVLLELELNKNGLRHMAAGQIDHTGKMIILDSLIGTPKESTMFVANAEYHKVYGMYAFSNLKCGDWLMF